MIDFIKTYCILLLFFFSLFVIMKVIMSDYRESQRIDFNVDAVQY